MYHGNVHWLLTLLLGCTHFARYNIRNYLEFSRGCMSYCSPQVLEFAGNVSVHKQSAKMLWRDRFI